MKKLRTAVLCLGLIALGLLFGGNVVDWVKSFTTGYSKICTLKMPMEDSYINIYTKSFLEVSQPLFYEVRAGEHEMVPRSFFATAPINDNLKGRDFTVLRGGQGRLVGVAFTSRPSAMVILHDFASHESWPGTPQDPGPVDTRGLQMLATLKETTGRPGLTLYKR